MLAPVTRSDLAVCPSCALPFVEPTAVHGVVDSELVLLSLTCVNCHWTEEGAYAEPAVEALDLALDEQALLLFRTHELLVRHNLGQEADRFAAALASGAILPEDF